MLLYDGNCGFCTLWVHRIRLAIPTEVRIAPSQDVADQFPQIPPEAFEQSVQWIESDGQILSGAKAAFRFLKEAGHLGRSAWWAYHHLPGFASLSEQAYAFVARNRELASTLTRWLWGPTLDRPTFHISAHLFLRFLALIYLIAFTSFWSQAEGLIGSQGILPAQGYLDRIQNHFGFVNFWQFPTLFWLGASDIHLHLVCAMGAVVSVAALIFPGFWFLWASLWFFYLSLSTVGQTFLSFQWDALLLETGFLTLFLVPVTGWRSPTPPPTRLVSWLFRFLLFRLMFSSGVVKLTSGDTTWWDLSALTFHYFTQPIPNLTAWYVHQLPDGIHALSSIGMFGIEILVPFLFFAPQRLRLTACILQVIFQLAILLTGNYTFFNLLTLTLCIWLIDDRTWPGNRKRISTSKPAKKRHPRPAWIAIFFTLFTLLITTMLFTRSTFRLETPWPEPVYALYEAQAPFHILNSYGLFRVMTTERPEIILEGSADGTTWKPYYFYYKAGDPTVPPPFVAPHQPRLDWQMWFAALRGDARNTPWFLNFCARILEGSPPVLHLLSHNPFPEAPPPYFRARLYHYAFTSFQEKNRTGHWWKRTLKGDFLSPIQNQFLKQNP
ncbi:MAG: lipase maturation factor family protein [bacterium]|nr:lipase maturation factor family protein [bacterium]